jgi:methylated-DNA-[protein]-cysteine S-methyltransferase
MTASPAWTVCESPIGPLTVVAGPQGIVNVHFDGHAPALPEEARRPLRQVVEQLEAYFAGERQGFELELEPRGSELQLAVWQVLRGIPYGKTTTYGEVAARIDESLYSPELEPYRRPRVVGQAIGANPLPVLVACHRVIGADGSLTGFFGGLERKRILLELEGASFATGAAEPDPARDQLALL